MDFTFLKKDVWRWAESVPPSMLNRVSTNSSVESSREYIHLILLKNFQSKLSH